jgi:hypothetical protein
LPRLPAYGEKNAVVLGIDLSVDAEREWSVGRSQCLIQDDVAEKASPLADQVQVAFLAVGEYLPRTSTAGALMHHSNPLLCMASVVVFLNCH